jgi:hypothetical protein
VDSAASDIGGGGVGSRVVGSKEGDLGLGKMGGLLGRSSLTSVSGSGSGSSSGDAGGGVGTLSNNATCAGVKYWLISMKYHPYSPLASWSKLQPISRVRPSNVAKYRRPSFRTL